MNQNRTIDPYISDAQRASGKKNTVPKRNRIVLDDELVAGDIILLWRIQFGTFTNETWFPKYFEYTYGIDAPRHLQMLLEKGYAYIETAFDSLDHLNATEKRTLLKEKEVRGLASKTVAELDTLLKQHYTEEELAGKFKIRGIALTEKGEKTLQKYDDVVARHPKKI